MSGSGSSVYGIFEKNGGFEPKIEKFNFFEVKFISK
jgi:hypothetical protein